VIFITTNQIAGFLMDFQAYKKEVIKGVCDQLDTEPWFRGVCLDTVLSSFQEDKTLEEAITLAAMETEWNDNPRIWEGK